MYHKFFTDNPEHPDEAGYTVEDGIVVNDEDRPETHKAFDYWSRAWTPSREQMRAEEAAWAARSGPVVIKRKGRQSA